MLPVVVGGSWNLVSCVCSQGNILRYVSVCSDLNLLAGQR